MKLQAFIKSGSISSTSFSFCQQRMISFNPARFAASTFSLIPPTGNTCPRKSDLACHSQIRFYFFACKCRSNAVIMVIPALGPSFGTAPSGHVYEYFFYQKVLDQYHIFLHWTANKLSAVLALSFITLPRLPVSFNSPFPSLRLVSIKRYHRQHRSRQVQLQHRPYLPFYTFHYYILACQEFFQHHLPVIVAFTFPFIANSFAW